MDKCNANVSGKLDTKIEDNRQFFKNRGEGGRLVGWLVVLGLTAL